MKKISLTLITVISVLQLTYGQWSTGTDIHNTNTGNVGIGTSTPVEKLVVAGNVNVGGQIRADLNSTGTSVVVTGTGSNFQISHDGTANVQLVNSGGGAFQFRNSTNSATFLHIDGGGSVGIGTTSPGANLDIQGTGTVLERILSFGSIATLQLRNSSQTWSVTNQGTLSVFDETAGLARISVLSGTGNVGIGTTTPGTYKLAVNGNVHAQQVSVDLAGWGDYVFDRDYTLPSLTQIKTYIDQNHHLPDIPSEQQVIKDGLNLGEMNKLLTKKVEELTLYLIEQDEKEKKQEMINSQLENKLKVQQVEINELNQKVNMLLTRIAHNQ
jgi:hypothetical protein